MNKLIIICILVLCICMSIFSGVGAYYYTTTVRSTETGEETGEYIGEDQDILQQLPPTASPWKCLSGITVPLRKNVSGDIECMSLDSTNCLWKSDAAECSTLVTTPPQNLNPLICGSMHKTKYGGTGYDNPEHWCAKGKIQL